MKEHPQAEILRAIADGKTVQRLKDRGLWVDASLNCLCNYPTGSFRIKPETITINGHEVPAPVREPLKPHQTYWVAGPDRECIAERFKWTDDPIENHWFKRGLIHLSEEAAIAHAEALLSFTRSDK